MYCISSTLANIRFRCVVQRSSLSFIISLPFLHKLLSFMCLCTWIFIFSFVFSSMHQIVHILHVLYSCYHICFRRLIIYIVHYFSHFCNLVPSSSGVESASSLLNHLFSSFMLQTWTKHHQRVTLQSLTSHHNYWYHNHQQETMFVPVSTSKRDHTQKRNNVSIIGTQKLMKK